MNCEFTEYLFFVNFPQDLLTTGLIFGFFKKIYFSEENRDLNERLMPSTDMIQLILTLKMSTTQVVETSVTVNYRPFQDYVHLEDHAFIVLPSVCMWANLASLSNSHISISFLFIWN